MMAHVAYIGMGSNLQDPQRQLQRAFDDLGGLPGTRLTARSSLYRSAPLGCPEQPDSTAQPDFVNAVAKIATDLPPAALLEALLGIEYRHGRERTYRNAPRTLDLDLLLFGDARIASPALAVPHPRMRERAFVLLPLQELAPDRVSPADLAAVAGQRIAPLPPASSPS